MNEKILVSKSKENEKTLILTLRRPERCNALASDTLRFFVDFLRQIETRPDIRVLILTGEGRHFSSGLDLCEAFDGTDIPVPRSEAVSFFGEKIPLDLFIKKSLSEQKVVKKNGTGGISDTREANHGAWGNHGNPNQDAGADDIVWIPKSFQMPRLVVEILTRLARLPQIVIAAARGAVFGGGGGILSVCDYAIADETLILGFPELKRGLAPSLLHPFLSRKLSETSLRRLLFLSQPANAEEALHMGMIQEIVPTTPGESPDPLLRRAENTAGKILLGEPVETTRTKRLLREKSLPPTSEVLRGLIDHWQSWESPNAQEGIAAFLEKRPPVWLVTDGLNMEKRMGDGKV